MDPDTKELLSNLANLLKQATEERSHYYVGKLVRESIETIERYDANLKNRDEFIVKRGLWNDFVDQLPLF